MYRASIVLIMALMVGCSATPIRKGAEHVKLTNFKPNDNCKYLGDITGSQGDFFTGRYTSNEILETGARNNLKNKADSMGGNLVVILTQRAGFSGKNSRQTNVTITGNVYNCQN